MNLTVVILTLNEERHIVRAIRSVSKIAEKVVVVDSGSSDKTCQIATDMGAVVFVNKFITQAQQFNWVLGRLPKETDWILRLDADEKVTPELANEINEKLPKLTKNVSGVYVHRRMHFLQKRINWGGVFPIKVLRLMRHGKGQCENRWMDEHIVVEGETKSFRNEIIDDNLNSLSWWTEKHNSYANREVIEILKLRHNFFGKCDSALSLEQNTNSGFKRWIKDNVYSRMPLGVRSFTYFFYRYFIRLGFLDGIEGTAFHVLQGFWYRYLVDIKYYEVMLYVKNTGKGIDVAVLDVLGIDINESSKKK